MAISNRGSAYEDMINDHGWNQCETMIFSGLNLQYFSDHIPSLDVATSYDSIFIPSFIPSYPTYGYRSKIVKTVAPLVSTPNALPKNQLNTYIGFWYVSLFR